MAEEKDDVQQALDAIDEPAPVAEKTDGEAAEPEVSADVSTEEAEPEEKPKETKPDETAEINKKLARLRKAEEKAERDAILLTEAKKQYGPLARARIAAAKGDMGAVRTLIEGVTKMRLEDILPKLQAAPAPNPELADLRRELAELRAATGRQGPRYPELDKHPGAPMPDFARLVEAEIEASWNAEMGDYGLTPREAADKVVARAKAAAAALGKPAVKGKPAPPARRKAPTAPPPEDEDERLFAAALEAGTAAAGRRR